MGVYTKAGRACWPKAMSLETILDLGFDYGDAKAALDLWGGDTEHGIQHLLSGSGGYESHERGHPTHDNAAQLHDSELAAALAASLHDTPSPPPTPLAPFRGREAQLHHDAELAAALAASLQDTPSPPTTPQGPFRGRDLESFFEHDNTSLPDTSGDARLAALLAAGGPSPPETPPHTPRGAAMSCGTPPHSQRGGGVSGDFYIE